MRRDHRLRGGAGEWRLAGQHLVQHAAETVEVAPAVDGLVTGCLLGAHVSGRTDRHARARECGDTLRRRAHRLADAEIGHHRVAILQQDVLGLDVAVHDAVAMGVVERVRYLLRDLRGVLHRQPLRLLQPLAQRLPFHDRHHVIEEPAGLTRIEQRHDVRMIEPGRQVDLAHEPIGTELQGQLRAEHLDGDPAVVSYVVREVDGGHATLAELELDRIAAGESRLEAKKHGGPLKVCRIYRARRRLPPCASASTWAERRSQQSRWRLPVRRSPDDA